MNGQNPRQIAIRILHRRSGSGEYIEKLLENELADIADYALAPPDRALCQELVYGIVRWQNTLDWLVAKKTGDRPQQPVLRLLLHLGLYQLFWLERIPNHAAVHETVELAKHLGFAAQAGFLNAVLRGFSREREATMAELAKLKERDLAVGYSHPIWLVDRWVKRWGPADAARLLAWNNTPPPTFARLNCLKTDLAALTAAWQQEGVDFEEQHWDWTGENVMFKLKAHPPLARSSSFQRGFFYVQDPSTLLAVNELNPQPDENILDLCAAPGGKTVYIAQRMQNRGRIVARDILPNRLNLVRSNCARLGVTCVVLEETQPAAPFDRILLDAPCSNTGVLRRRVDLRWRVKLGEVERLRDRQRELLDQAASQLKAGGTLVYSTCSLEPEENELLTAEFLTAHPEFKPESQRQLLPFKDGVDGAYVARLRKSG